MRAIDRMNRNVLGMACASLGASVSATFDWRGPVFFFLGFGLSCFACFIYYAVKAKKAGQL